MILTQENVLGKNHFNQLEKLFEDSTFAWYWQSDTNYGNKEVSDVTKSGFRHCFFKEDESISNYSPSVIPIVCAMADLADGNLESIYSVHANMLLNHNKQMEPEPHVDVTKDLFLAKNRKLITGIFYLETVDGDTLFFNDDKKTIKQKVSPLKNSMVIFDSKIFHSASLPLKAVRRRVINVNIVIEKNVKVK